LEFRPANATARLFPAISLRDRRLKQRATELGGYDTTPAGLIRFAA
jgi:hypothetical protein